MNKNSPWYMEDDAEPVAPVDDKKFMTYVFRTSEDMQYFMKAREDIITGFGTAGPNLGELFHKNKVTASYMVAYYDDVDKINIDPDVPENYFRVFFSGIESFQEINLK